MSYEMNIVNVPDIKTCLLCFLRQNSAIHGAGICIKALILKLWFY